MIGINKKFYKIFILFLIIFTPEANAQILSIGQTNAGDC